MKIRLTIVARLARTFSRQMSIQRLPLLCFGLALASSANIAAADARVVVHEVKISGPTIVAFVPSEVQGQKDDGTIEGIAHTQFALQDTAKCLGSKKVTFRFLFADRLVVRNGTKKTTIKVGQLGQGFGSILVEPRRAAKVVYSEDGPSTLQSLLPRAAFEYWYAQGCKDVG